MEWGAEGGMGWGGVKSGLERGGVQWGGVELEWVL